MPQTQSGMKQHTLTTWRSAEALEALDTEADPIRWIRETTEDFTCGDGVIITTADGCTFLGDVVDVEDYSVYVTLT